MKNLISKEDVKRKLRRIFRQGTPHATYDGGCRGVDFDWDAIDKAIDSIPAPPVKLDDRQGF